MGHPKPRPPRYIPDTDQVREIVAHHLTKPAPHAYDGLAHFTVPEGRHAFNRWLAYFAAATLEATAAAYLSQTDPESPDWDPVVAGSDDFEGILLRAAAAHRETVRELL